MTRKKYLNATPLPRRGGKGVTSTGYSNVNFFKKYTLNVVLLMCGYDIMG
jgi:hypothetical protein